MAKSKAEWHTPISVLKNKEKVWQLIEEKGWAPPELDTTEPITYFNNPVKYEWSEQYDRFFAYTKMFPLWDRRKTKDNSQVLRDVRENIFNQEVHKTVPALTSMTYGRPARIPLELPDCGFRRVNAIGDFRRRRGVMRVIETKPK